jgi:hypothetical protein
MCIASILCNLHKQTPSRFQTCLAEKSARVDSEQEN